MEQLPALQSPSSDDIKAVQGYSAEQQNLELDYRQNTGSVKITPELERLCIAAINGRIESTADYTASRIEKVNANWLTYHSNQTATRSVEKDQPLSNYNGSEAFVACQDTLDDLFGIFSNWAEQLDLQDKSQDSLRYLSARLQLDETDEDPKMAKIRTIYNSLSPEDKQELLSRNNAFEISDETDLFYYQKKSAILSFLRDIVEKSEYQKHSEEALLHLIVTGDLVLRDNYCHDYRSQLIKTEDGLSIELNKSPKAVFMPVDTRNLIFGPNTNWTIEKVRIRFSEMLNRCLDANGKPKKNCPYDMEQVRKVAEFIRTNGASTLMENPAGQEVNETLDFGYFDQTDYSDLYDIDGDIVIYEAHNIPMQIEKKKVHKCVITAVNFNGSIQTADAIPKLYIIGAKKSPYIDGIAHHHLNMFFRKDDQAGLGVIDAIYPLYQVMNNLVRQLMDLTKPGRSGTILTTNEKALKITPIGDRTVISVPTDSRSNKGLSDIMQPWPSDYNMINTLQNIIPVIEQRMKTASRKGPSGEKMSPNPSATEFTQIASELQKSVNLVAIKYNNFLKDWIKRAYIYTIINTIDEIQLKVQMERLDNKGDLTTTEKILGFNASELFIDGMDIELKAYDNYQKTAVQKQQLMQITNLLYTSGMLMNPQTGQPITLTDEAGTTYQISMYKLWKLILDKFDMSDVMTKVNTNAVQQQQVTNPNVQPNHEGQPGQPTEGVPPMEAGTNEADIMAQLGLSQGMNV